MKDDAADDLHWEMAHPKHAVARLAADSERVRQNIVERLAVCQAFFKRRRHSLQLGVAFGLICFFQRKNLLLDRINAL